MATPPPLPETTDRISAGVAAGIITPDQAQALRKLPLDSMPEQFAATRTGDEPFALFRGFRDVFLAIGVVIMAVGLGGVLINILDFSFAGSAPLAVFVVTFVLAAVAWLMAEWITGRLRMPLASLILMCAFSYTAAVGVIVALPLLKLSNAVFVFPLIVSSAALLFYLRFRLPSAMLIIGGGVSLALYNIVDSATGGQGLVAFQLYALLSGLAIFVLGLYYELRDPQRVQRQSENAFWLHLLAAPLIVFALTGGATSLDVGSTGEALRLFAVVFSLGLLALLIDRRAFIVSALLYLAGAIAYTVSQSGAAPDTQFAITALALGLFVVGLALGWHPLRQAFLGFLPDHWSSRLPNPAGPDALGG